MLLSRFADCSAGPQAAWRKSSICLSQPTIWFQLASGRDANSKLLFPQRLRPAPKRQFEPYPRIIVSPAVCPRPRDGTW